MYSSLLQFSFPVNRQMAGIAGERVPATPVGYIADVNITKSGSSAATRRLHFGEDAERPSGTPAEALMRGYGAA